SGPRASDVRSGASQSLICRAGPLSVAVHNPPVSEATSKLVLMGRTALTCPLFHMLLASLSSMAPVPACDHDRSPIAHPLAPMVSNLYRTSEWLAQFLSSLSPVTGLTQRRATILLAERHGLSPFAQASGTTCGDMAPDR